MIAVFDRVMGICVGFETWPLDGGMIKVSKDEGDGNGYGVGNEVYFKFWDNSTGKLYTATEVVNDTGEPLLFGSEINDAYSTLTVHKDTYNIYRNGALLESNWNQTTYEDATLESGFPLVSKFIFFGNLIGSSSSGTVM